ncbi:MAG: daunorubicin resistance protein DrrA family ABC transporter ATP-binding protein [Actinomycetota bacterium]|nr:MAG: daunorubicin resistance protein DrrA family ABC transporter ATP-binding protein [Actinomycetota bacterium]
MVSAPGSERAAVEAIGVTRRFGDVVALREVSLRVPRGEIHALLGPNGAGKTTLLRILTGALLPDAGRVSLVGLPADGLVSREYRRAFGLVPSGDRTFYLRLSGSENLLFFARLQGLPKREAARRVRAVLEAVGLADVGRMPVNAYSHGMQKRLSVARALLADPPVLIVDEATHDLDPDAAARVQELVRGAADRGTAVVWATQRIEEIRGFADRVTLLHRGEVRFSGTIPGFLAAVPDVGYLVHVRAGAGVDGPPEGSLYERAAAAVGGRATVRPADGEEAHLVVTPAPGATLGEALCALREGGLEILGVREERPGVEQAFRWFTRGGGS